MRNGYIGLIFAALATHLHAEEVDWRVYGSADEVTLFFSASDLRRDGQMVRVWTETLDTKAVDAALEANVGAIDLGARLLRAYYLPPLAIILDLKPDAIAEMIAAEVAADGYLAPKTTMVLYEIDCKGERFRILSAVTYRPDGKVNTSSSTAATWDYTPPGTNGSRLTKIVCNPINITKKTPVPPR